MSTFRTTTLTLAVIAAAGTVAAAGLASATPGSSAQKRPAAAWHVAKTVPGKNFPLFSAVTATSAGSAWAFESFGGTPTKPVAYRLTGSTWTRQAFPGRRGEGIVAATSSSPRNVWAFTSDHRALRFNGHGWTAMKTFGKAIGSGLALSRSDVWVFGEPYVPGAGLATWHYNGKAWTRSATGNGLLGASALAPDDIWAFGFTKVANWNGHSWTTTSVASVLPPNTPLCRSHLTGIWAQSAGSVWAIGTGGCQDQGGPLVLLRYNGASWSRVARINALGAPVAIVPDGMGGAWIPVLTGFPGSGSMEHLTSGTLSPVRLPIGPSHLALFSAAIGPHTTVALAVGYSRRSFGARTTTAVILRYGV